MQADTTSTHLRAPDDLAPPDRRGSNGSAPPRKRAAPGEEDTRKRPPKGRRGKAAKAPETQDEDLDSLIEQFNTLLMSGQMSAQAKQVIKYFLATPIESISVGSPCTVTTAVPHNLNTGDTVCISGVTDGSFSSGLNSTTTTRTITVDSPTTFRLNGTNSVNCTIAPTATGLTNAHVSVITYNQGASSPSNTNRRDRIRGILHLILTSPDFTIQR